MMKHLLVSFYSLLLLTFVTRSCADQSDYSIQPEYDLCDPKVPVIDPPRIYMDRPGVATEIFVNWTIERNDTMARQCHMLLKSCPSCRIKVEAVEQGFFNTICNSGTDSTDGIITDCLPGCIYMYMYDNFYKNVSGIKAFSSNSVTGYNSLSSQLNILACAVGPFFRKQNISMRLRFTVIEKIQEIAGDPYTQVPRRTFMSPNFPNPYVSNSENYTFNFQSAFRTDFITVSFDDWVVSPNSEFTIEDANVIKVNGLNRRPYITSNGPTMSIVFNTGEFRISGSYFTFLGFKAIATFYKDRVDIPDIQTDCGQMITSKGGTITLAQIADGSIRDCIWVIKKTPEFEGVYLKLLRYRVGQDLRSYENRLEIRDGLTSTTENLLSVNPNAYGGSEDFDARSDVGFYIRLKGSYRMEDSLVISYAMFISDCTNNNDYFKCSNGRCLPVFLKCDTYDHCGDKSDESSCNGVSGGSSNRGSDYSISIGVIIPMVVSVFLVIVMCLLIIFIRRCRRLNNSAYGNRPNVLTQPQDRGRRRRRHNHNVQMSVTVSSGEHPPSYEEVIQNTPIGYLNMAFSWFQSDTTPTAPPTYEEAIMPPSATPSQDATPAVALGSSNSNLLVQGTATISSPRHQVSRATFMASLDPGAYVSSSSSSEYASEPENRLDVSSSSDTSTDESPSFITNRTNRDLSSRTSLDLNKDSNKLSVAQNASKLVSNSTGKPGPARSDMQVELDDQSLSKIKTPDSTGGPAERSRRDRDARKNERNFRENGDRGRRGRTNSKDDRIPDKLENATRDKLNDPENGRSGLFVKRNHKKPVNNGLESPNHFSENASKVTESSRSQSCFDLSLGGAVTGAGPSYGKGESRNEDKRFSYAGNGDVSLKREDLDPFYTGRGLVRDRPIENLNKYTAQSCDNLLQGYNVHANRDHPTVRGNPQQASNSCLDVSQDRKDKHPHHTSNLSLNKFLDTGRTLHPVTEIQANAEPDRHQMVSSLSRNKRLDENMKSESYPAQAISDLKPLQSVPKSTHDYKSAAAISRPEKQGQASKGAIPKSNAANMLTLIPGPNLVLSDVRISTQEHQRILSPNSDSDRATPSAKDISLINSSEHNNINLSSNKPGLPLSKDQYTFENPHRADAQLRARQPQSAEPIYDRPVCDEFRSHPESVLPSDRSVYQKETPETTYQKPNQSRELSRMNSGSSLPTDGNVRHHQGPEPIYQRPNLSQEHGRLNSGSSLPTEGNVCHRQGPEPIYQRPNLSQEHGRLNSGSSLPTDGNVRHNQRPEPIYKKPNNRTGVESRSNRSHDLTLGDNISQKQRPEPIYQVPRQNQEQPSSSQLQPSHSVGSVHQKPTPAPRQAKKRASDSEREQAPIPRMRSLHGADRQVKQPDNSSLSMHPAQQTHRNQRPVRFASDRSVNSAGDEVGETELNRRSDQVVLTLDPHIFQANENDVFV